MTYSREAQSYQYLNEKFEVVHHTSVPLTDALALKNFQHVQNWFPKERITYITRKDWDGPGEYKMMPYRYNPDTKEVTSIEGT